MDIVTLVALNVLHKRSISGEDSHCRSTGQEVDGGAVANAKEEVEYLMDNGTMRMCRTIMSSSITLSCMSCMRLHAT